MFMTSARAGLFALAASVGAVTSASAGVPMPATALTLAGQVQTTPVTFWAHPYPYRYAPLRRHCPLVRVETPYGWYWDRVCVAGEPVLRRAY